MGKVATDKGTIVTDVPRACSDELAAVEFLESLRWDGEFSCPRCGDTNVYQMQGRDGGRERGYRWRCRGCGDQYTVRTGTVMEDSRIPLRFWVHAYWRAASSKKGVSALQLKRETGLTYKSALFLLHRIRWAMADSAPPKLGGDVEVDETYVGGKPRRPVEASKAYQRTTGRKVKPGPSADFVDRKIEVVALVSRDGQARAYVAADVQGHNLKDAIREHVAPSATIHTDQLPRYKGIGKDFAGGHHTVNHSVKEYARRDGNRLVTTNTVEGFFALLKRGVIGTYHAVSKKHLHRYVSEFEFRWNHRRIDDGARVKKLIQAGEGKRLRYRVGA